MSRRQLSPAATVFLILLVPLAMPALFVFLGPSADPLSAQEPRPKMSFDQPLRTSESLTNSGTPGRQAVNARSRTEEVASSSPQKPSGKMEFVPDSPAPRAKRPSAAARTAANSVARRQIPNQPAKIAATRSTPLATPRRNAPSIQTPPPSVPQPVAEPEVESIVEVEQFSAPVAQLPVRVAKPTQSVKKELEVPVYEPEPEAEPEVVVNSQPAPPAEFSERPEPSLPDFELPVVSTPRQPMPARSNEIIVGDAVPPNPAGRDVVNLYFEEESTDEDEMTEKMDLAEQEADEEAEFMEPVRMPEERPRKIVEPMPPAEIRSIAAQEKPEEPKAEATAIAEEEAAPTPSDAILAELKPVRSIEIRKAVEVPALAEMENPQLHEPADQARAMLKKRPPFKFWPVYRDPWTANRDSYAFHHNPLWFEDPNLERCGRGKGHFTSVSSFLQFNANVAFLPYRMTAQPPFSCVRTLPDCTVCQKYGCDAYLPPWSWPAAAVQGGAIFGFIYAIP